jgi:hypothetical protein
LYAFTERIRKIRNAAAVEARLLEQYVGAYRFGAFRGSVKMDNGQLVFDLGPMGSVPLTPMSPRRFFCEQADIEVEFEHDAADTVTGLQFQQGDLELRFNRELAAGK